MHELSIAMSIIELAEEQADSLHARIVAIRLRLGPLSGVDPTALASAFALATENTPLADARLAIEKVPVTAFCNTCNKIQQIASIQDMACPVCGTPAADLRTGRELEVIALEVLDAADTADRSPAACA